LKITAISDLHGFIPKLPEGDLLIVAGDLTARHSQEEFDDFLERYLYKQFYKKTVFIGGNHDSFFEKNPQGYIGSVEYLENSGTSFKGIKIWGSPWSLSFKGIHPECRAFTKMTEDELNDHWRLIPDDTEILVTHTPPYGILDMVEDIYEGNRFHAGSTTLLRRIKELKKLKLHVFGHIHEGFGTCQSEEVPGVHFYNASYVDRNYKPSNFPHTFNMEK